MSRLTDVSIRALKAGPQRREIPDGGARGLYVIVQPSGRKSFAVRFRFGGVPKKLTLSGGLSLAAARKLAATAMHEVAEGRDPARAKRAAKERAADAAKDTLRGVCTQYFQHKGARELRTAYERERIITRLVYSARVAKRPIAEITRREITELLDLIEANNGQRSADVVLSILRRVYRWHRARDDGFISFPFIPEMSRYSAGEHARARALDDRELRGLWAALGEAGVYGLMLKFLLYTSARLREAARMRWEEIGDDGMWEVPRERNKTKKNPLARPLPAIVFEEVLDKLPRFAGCPYVFTVDGKHAFSGFSRHKKKLDIALAGQIREPWVVHDLRRTARSLMSRALVPVDHAERVLGHVIGGVRGVYDRHAFHAEKKAALEALGRLIERIVHPQENIVVADIGEAREARTRTAG